MDDDLKKYIKDNQHLINPGSSDSEIHSDDPDIKKYLNANKSLIPPKASGPEQQPSVLQTLGHHIPQGTLAGFSDEVAGAGSALANQAGINATQSQADQDIGLRPDLAAKPSKIPDYHPSYTEGRDQERSDLAKTRAAHPYIAPVAEFTGGIAPAILSGGSVAGGAALGGATGLGSSDQDLANNAPGAIKGTLKDVALGTALGAGAAKLGNVITNKLNPEALEQAANKSAVKSIGLKPSKDLATEFNEETGKLVRGSDITKGVGKTLLETNSLPMTGGGEAIYDATSKALAENETKLMPALKQAQMGLDQNPDQVLQEVGAITTKIPKVMQDLAGEIPDHSGKEVIVEKLGQAYSRYEDKLANADGNLEALNEVKRELTSAAKLLSPNAYKGGLEKYEASLYKRMGGVVRQHIEDLANAVDSGAGDQIHQINKTTQNLSTALPYAAKTMDKGPSIGLKDVALTGIAKIMGAPAIPLEATKLGAEVVSGNPISRLAHIGAAQTFKKAAKIVQTPVGQLVQKSVTPTAQSGIANPWSQSLIHSKPQPVQQKPESGLNESSDLLQRYRDTQKQASPQQATEIAATLYNATDDSLQQVSSKLSFQPGLKFLAESLDKAIKEKDTGAKNRSIFLIMQNPTSRKLVSPEG